MKPLAKEHLNHSSAVGAAADTVVYSIKAPLRSSRAETAESVSDSKSSFGFKSRPKYSSNSILIYKVWSWVKLLDHGSMFEWSGAPRMHFCWSQTAVWAALGCYVIWWWTYYDKIKNPSMWPLRDPVIQQVSLQEEVTQPLLHKGKVKMPSLKQMHSRGAQWLLGLFVVAKWNSSTFLLCLRMTDWNRCFNRSVSRCSFGFDGNTIKQQAQHTF